MPPFSPIAVKFGVFTGEMWGRYSPSFPNRGQLFLMRSLPLPLATGRKFDTFTALSYYALILNPITPKNPKIFVPHGPRKLIK